jgi:DNA-directed RNA polymerase specialized sigma24 family protein
MSHYLDNVEFTRLLQNNKGNRNRRRIAEGLHLIALGVRNKYLAELKNKGFAGVARKRRMHDIDDAAADACETAIRKIGRFDRRRGNGFDYFTTVISRQFSRQIKRAITQQSRQEPLSDFE